MRGRPRAASDDELVDATATLFEAGEVLGGNGGVPPGRIAGAVGISTHTAADHLRRLADEGRIEKSVGIGEKGMPKTTYQPVEADR